jgi:hypothetical protein
MKCQFSYLSFHSIVLMYVVLWLYHVMNQLLHNMNSQFQRWDKLTYETKIWGWVISTEQYHKLIGFNSWSKVIDAKCVRSFFTIAYFTPIWKCEKKTLKPRQISLAKICTILFSIPRKALSDSRHKQKSKCVPVWVTKNDTVWRAAIAHHAYWCTTAFWSEGKLTNEYTWPYIPPFTANISWTHVWWGYLLKKIFLKPAHNPKSKFETSSTSGLWIYHYISHSTC